MINLDEIMGSAPRPQERQRLQLSPGIYQNIHHRDYNDIDALRNSYLKKIRKCAASAQVEDPDDTKALIFGRAAHAMTLEGDDAFHSEFIVLPDEAPKRPTDRQIFAKKPSPETLYAVDWWNRFTAQSNGKSILTKADYQTLQGVRNSVRSHPFAKLLLTEGVSETTVIFEVECNGQKVLCKVRPDRTPAVQMKVLIDLKTTEDAGYDAFIRSCKKFGYFQQAAFYIDGYNAVRGDLPEMDSFAFIAVEKKPPYRCEVYTLSGDSTFLLEGRQQYQDAIKREIECRAQGFFYPNYVNAGCQELLPYSEMGL
ncbi:MAG: hypothetical protein A2Y38_16270 [Spirochaetes bacterium GWB1_59_5]|nr:MAG: hypothetical protein A2Y38_16270 [Spirochaetes bacterium GWB1_59_5]